MFLVMPSVTMTVTLCSQGIIISIDGSERHSNDIEKTEKIN
jgi:hypothetical protein